MPTKYVFVTGGVLSGLGKGITAASIGNLLKARGLKVNIQKCDPYLNVDAGTLNPREHGECFVTKDGAETDLDLGHYERFLDEELTQASSLMSGRIMLKVIQDERDGNYEGGTVQIIPHVTNAIQAGIQAAAEGYDVHIVEIGGTVGDYESLAFVEAIRELGQKVGLDNCCYVHVVYLPYLGASKETKTKPAQNAVRELRGLGISPNVIAARSEEPAGDAVRRKLSMYCGVGEEAIALLPNASSIYEVPLTLENDGIGEAVVNQLGLSVKSPELGPWQEVVARAVRKFDRTITIGVAAKYLDNQDTYMSVFEALKSAAMWNDTNIDIRWIDAEQLTDDTSALQEIDGVVVPGGFGTRGVDGKIATAQYSLTNNLPYLGICYGMQIAVIAAARLNGLNDAHTREVDPTTANPVITTMVGQEGKENTGGTMRLGDYRCDLAEGSLASRVYQTLEIVERHRHRYECNPDYTNQYESWGIKATGINPDNSLVEVIEGLDHPFFLASQFHPELKSRPNRPHQMFDGFIKAVLTKKA